MTDDFNVANALYDLADSDEISMPTGSIANIKEMTGNEQRNFMNKGKLMSGVAIQELLSACVESIDDKPLSSNPEDRQKFLLDLLSGDRQALVFHIRRYSLGDSFMFSAKCPVPDCGASADWEVDLSKKSDFPTKPYKLGNEKTVTYESKIKPGLKIRFKHLDGHAEMSILRKRNSIHSLSDLEMRQPQAFEPGVAPLEGRWITILINKLPDRLITEMRRVILDHEGSVDTTVKVVCKSCAAEVVFDLLQQQDFMTPSVTS